MHWSALERLLASGEKQQAASELSVFYSFLAAGHMDNTRECEIHALHARMPEDFQLLI